MAKATLTISSKNYSSWSLRGWLLTRFSGLDFEEITTAPDDPSARAEILLLSPTILVPCLRHEGATVWDTLAIAEYLNEARPDAGLLPSDRVPASRSGRARRPTSTGSAPSGAIAWASRAGRSCSARAPWRMRCMRRS
jgi:glutathione S-transferase